MVIYYNETNNDGSTYIKRLASTDGVDWGTTQTVITLPNYVMSPAVIHDGSVYTMWYVRSVVGCTAASQAFYRRTSADGITWGPEVACTFDHPGRVLWHLDVQLNAGLYTMLFISYPNGSSCGNTTMYYAESTDGLAWTANPDPFLSRVVFRLGQRQHVPRLVHHRRRLPAGLVLGHVQRAASGGWATPRATWTSSSRRRPTPGPSSWAT